MFRLRWTSPTILLTLLWISVPAAAFADPAPLYPREVFFETPGRTAPSISPDGLYLAWLAPADGSTNIWLAPIGELDRAAALTHVAGGGIADYLWAEDGRHLLYFADRDGDENAHLFSVDRESHAVVDLTPWNGVKAQDAKVDARQPDYVLVGVNRRDPRVFDEHRIHLLTGADALEAQNPGDVVEWLPDSQFRVRACAALDSLTADILIRVRDRADGPWRQIADWPFLENNDIVYQKLIAWGAGDKTLIVQNSLASNTSQIKEIDLKSGRDLRVIASDSRADVANEFAPGYQRQDAALCVDPADGRIQAACFEYQKPEWKVLDPAVASDFKALETQVKRPFTFLSRTHDQWLVGAISDTGPMEYFLYDRKTFTVDSLFADRPKLAGLTLAPMTPVTIKARDGLELVAYLTLPVGVPAKNLPMVVNPHGGPWWRDSWGYNPEVQWMANRGYAVLQVQFRGSTGFGKAALNSAIGQWGVGAMQHDVTDAVQWAVAQGYADPKRVAIFGWSYGGYCTLAGITFTPELYACAVDGVGPANVATLFHSFPAYWGPRKVRWIRRVGDVEHDEALNERISPFHHVDSIKAPLLIGHGANDPRVKLAESEAMVAAMRAKNLPVTLVVYPDEGHGFSRQENNLDFYGRAEEFFGKYLGGRVEPWHEVPGATAQVR